MKLSIPQKPNTILNTLRENGYDAYVVGGCVRDTLLGLTPHDWDICTDATPAEIKKCFSDFNLYDAGEKHGTISVVIDGEVLEVTTFRVDGEYRDNRHPESVSFTDSLTDDLGRRDFTVNAMAYSDEKGLIDPYGGREDLRRKVIRCVGNPDKRFNEDALRIMRALRFAATYGFAIERYTAFSLRRNAELLNNIAVERINAELCRLICGRDAEKLLDAYRDVIAVFIPELRECFDFQQHNKHHCYDVYRHMIHSVGRIAPDPLLRMSMLLHDIGKPRSCSEETDGTRHFRGHQQISADIGRDILRRLKFPNAFIDDSLLLILYHDVRFNGSKRQIKRVLQKLGEQNMRRLFQVQRADILSQSEFQRAKKLTILEDTIRLFEEILRRKECFSLKQLAVNGRDLIAIGVTDGRQIGGILNKLLNEVIDGRLENDKTVLLNIAKRYYYSGAVTEKSTSE